MNSTTTDRPQEDQNIGMSFTDFVVTLGQEKKIFLIFFMCSIILSVLLAFFLPRSYVANTVLLPPQQQSSSAANALAQLGALSGMAGASTGVKSPDEMYIALLKSRSVQDALILQFNLKARYGTATFEQTRKRLSSKVNISSNKKSGFITIEAADADPIFSAQLTNAHVGQLRKLLTRLAITDAQQRRMFFDQQVSKTKAALNSAESKFREAQANSGLVVTQALAEAGVKEGTQLRAQIAAREVQQQTLSRFVTPEHSELQRIGAELIALRRQLTDIEQGNGKNSVSTSSGSQAVQAFRDMKIQEAMLETLIKQLEIARADEAKEGPLLQQVDQASPPELPSKPNKKIIISAGIGIGLLLGALGAITNKIIKKQNMHENWLQVKSAWQTNQRVI